MIATYGFGAWLADHLHEFETVENRHRPVSDDDVGNIVRERFQARGSVLGFIDFARAKAMQ